MDRTVACILLIVLGTLAGITVYKIDQMPHNKSCVDITCPSCAEKVECDNYNYVEKIRYVWNLY
jgi:hypothetical protein